MIAICFRLFVCTLIVMGLPAGSSLADDQTAEALDFKKHVLPVLETKCIRCHGAQRRDGKLDLRTLDSMLAGGVSGPAIKKGNSKKSLLIELIHFNEMPPKKVTPRVTKEELELLQKWIDEMPASRAASSHADS